MQEITITLPVETVNAAIGALTKLPYEFSQPHIDLLRQRGNAALEALEKAAPSSDANYGGND